MELSITKIGNSKGIIIPAHFLKQCGFSDKVSLNVEENKLIISKPKQPREGWDGAFVKANSLNDAPLIDDVSNSFDDGEWTW